MMPGIGSDGGRSVAAGPARGLQPMTPGGGADSRRGRITAWLFAPPTATPPRCAVWLALIALAMAAALGIFFALPYQFLDREGLRAPAAERPYLWSRWLYLLVDRPPSAVLNIVGLVIPPAVLGGLWATGLRLAARGRAGRAVTAVALAAPLVMSLSLVTAYPRISHDVFHYMAEARVLWVYGDNPFLVPPRAHSQDVIYGYVLNWRGTPSPYGPAWALLNFFPQWLGGDEPLRLLIAFKVQSAVFFAATVAVIYMVVRRLRPGLALLSVVLVGWSPFAVLLIGDAAPNDPLMLLFLLLAWYLALDRRWLLALPVLAVAVAVKFVAALAAPALLIYAFRRAGDRRSASAGAAFSLALLALLFAPFWAGRDTFATVVRQDDFFLESLAAILSHIGARLGVGLETAEQVARGFAAGSIAVTFVAVTGWQLRRPNLYGFALASATLTVTAYLLLADVWFQPWYLLWALVLAGAILPVAGRGLALGVSIGGLAVVLLRPTTWGWEPEAEVYKDTMNYLLWVIPLLVALAPTVRGVLRQARAASVSQAGSGSHIHPRAGP